jgi:hypothetical protein
MEALDPSSLTERKEITEAGFLLLNKYFITNLTDRSVNTVWQALRYFHFDKNLHLPCPAVPKTTVRSHSVEFSPQAEQFLRLLHRQYASNTPTQGTGLLLSPVDLKQLLRVLSDPPKPLLFPSDFVRMEHTGLNVDSFVLLWKLSLSDNAQDTIRSLITLGFEHADDKVGF